MNVLVIASQPDIPGAGTRHALLERGARLERQRIIALLQKQTAHDENGDLMLAEYWQTIVALIECVNCVPNQQSGIWTMCSECGETVMDELQRVADETGERENFDNPLIDGDTK